MFQSFLAQSIASFDWHYGARVEMWVSEKAQFNVQRMRAIPHEQGEAVLVWLSVEYPSVDALLKSDKKRGNLRGFLLLLFAGTASEPALEKFVASHEVADFLFRLPDVARLKHIVEQLPQEQTEAAYQGIPSQGESLVNYIQRIQ